jgi:hypothetical protein
VIRHGTGHHKGAYAVPPADDPSLHYPRAQFGELIVCSCGRDFTTIDAFDRHLDVRRLFGE